MTSAFNWRAIFWFLTIVSGLSLVSFILFFRDTFRRERSLNYQNVIRQRRKAAALSNDKQPVNPDLTFADLNPLKPLGQVLRRKNNILVYIASGNFPPPLLGVNVLTTLCVGCQFSYMYLLAYASARTLGISYGYSPIKIGFVTLAFGIGKLFLSQDFSNKLIVAYYTCGLGCIAGSLSGGRWSDSELARLKAANGGKMYPEVS